MKNKEIVLILLLVLIFNFTGCINKEDDKRLQPNQSEKVNSNSNIISIKGKTIISETKKDIDSDGSKERIVLDINKEDIGQSPAKYTRMLIYDTDENDKVTIFSSENEGVQIDGDYLDSQKKDLIKIQDLNGDGSPEIYLQEYAYASDAVRTAIVQKIDGVYKILFFDHLESLNYRDFDVDGKYELYGVTVLGQYGDGLLYGSQKTVFKLKDDKYLPSYDLTKRLIEEECVKKEREFEMKGNYEALVGLLSCYSTIGYSDKGVKLIKDNLNLLEEVNQETQDEENEQLYIDSYKKLEKKNKSWLDSLKN